MAEERYIKITSCKDCGFTGHSYDAITNQFYHICGNPDTMELDVPKAKLVLYYPITSQTVSLSDSPIPAWCKLPSDIDVTQPEEMEN